MRAALYARVSTLDQDPDAQLYALREYVTRRGWALVDEFVDHGVSGSRESRPQLDRLMKAAKRREIDAVVVWKFDRFARSTKQLILALEEFQALGVEFISITEAVDTSTPGGRALYGMLGVFGQFERDQIASRVQAGLAKAKAQGTVLGRPRVEVDVEAAHQLLLAGTSLRGAARELGVSRATLTRRLREGGSITLS